MFDFKILMEYHQNSSYNKKITKSTKYFMEITIKVTVSGK